MADNYGELFLDELQQELKTRGAKISGRKSELVDRYLYLIFRRPIPIFIAGLSILVKYGV